MSASVHYNVQRCGKHGCPVTLSGRTSATASAVATINACTSASAVETVATAAGVASEAAAAAASVHRVIIVVTTAAVVALKLAPHSTEQGKSARVQGLQRYVVPLPVDRSVYMEG